MMCENTLPNKIDLPIKIQAHAKRAILFKLLKNMKEKKSVFQFNKAKKKYILMIGENQRHIDEPICIQYSEYLRKNFDFDVHYIYIETRFIVNDTSELEITSDAIHDSILFA